MSTVIKRMRILFLSIMPLIQARRLLEYFAAREYDVHLVTFSPYTAIIRNVKTHQITNANNIFTRIRYLRKVIKKTEPDILQAYGISCMDTVPAAFSGFHPLIYNAIGSDIAVGPEESLRVKLLTFFALNRADLVSTSDESVKKRLIELGCAEKKIFIAPTTMAVDVHQFSPDARSQSLRKKLGIEDKYSVIIARRLQRKYSIDVFIKAIPHVLKKMRNVKFIIGGWGPQESKLKELAKKLNVFEFTEFVGEIPHDEMPKYLASVDLYVDTFSDYWPGFKSKAGSGIGSTTMEAMACSTPQVLADRMKVKSGAWFQGIMFKQLDPADLAEKIVFLLGDEKLRIEIGLRSRKVALEMGDWEKCMKVWEKKYASLAYRKGN